MPKGIYRRRDLEDRFWEKVSIPPDIISGCWTWTASRRVDGYGASEKGSSAHRTSWKLVYGEIPNGLWVCHHCDVPLCVNPNHLFLGTQADNVADQVRKGRTVRGERNGRAILTWDLVSRIRSEYSGKRGEQKELAKAYGLHPSYMSAILRGKLWKQ